MHFVDRNVVDFSFGLAQPLKDRGRGLFDGSRKSGSVNQLQDILQMPVSGGVPADDAEFRSCNAAAFCFLDSELRTRTETLEREYHGTRIRAGVDQCADRHISADAGEGVQVADFHAINWGNSSPDGPCKNWSMASESTVSAMLISTTRAPEALAICASHAAA